MSRCAMQFFFYTPLFSSSLFCGNLNIRLVAILVPSLFPIRCIVCDNDVHIQLFSVMKRFWNNLYN
jgi:hypothetical protein